MIGALTRHNYRHTTGYSGGAAESAKAFVYTPGMIRLAGTSDPAAESCQRNGVPKTRIEEADAKDLGAKPA